MGSGNGCRPGRSAGAPAQQNRHVSGPGLRQPSDQVTILGSECPVISKGARWAPGCLKSLAPGRSSPEPKRRGGRRSLERVGSHNSKGGADWEIRAQGAPQKMPVQGDSQELHGGFEAATDLQFQKKGI